MIQAIEFDAIIDSHNEIHIKLPLSTDKRKARVIVLLDEAHPEPTLPAMRQFGSFRGMGEVPDDFDDPLPDSFWTGEKP